MSVVKFFSADDKPYGCFSNFAQCTVVDPLTNLIFPTSEHYYHYLKYDKLCRPKVLKDSTEEKLLNEMMEEIRCSDTPYKAKILANGKSSVLKYEWQNKLIQKHQYYINQGIPSYDPVEWSKISTECMKLVLKLKFNDSNNIECLNLLLETGNAVIQENSPFDSHWGIGKDGKGNNLSGKLLMELRDEMRKE